jgi:hypothetical protein
MLQKFMEGKKKYSAFIITILATLIPLLIQEPETQKTFMDLVPSLAVLISGIVYIVTEGSLDKKKVESQTATAQAVAANGSAAAGAPAAGAPAQPPAAVAQPVVEPTPMPFDPKAFHQGVLDTIKETYTEVNPCTLFYKARDKGSVTDCQSIGQAVDYWNYLVDLAVDAKDWIKEETAKKAGECGRSPEYYVFNRDFNTTIRAANALTELATAKIDWRSKLAPFNRTLYGVGALADQLLSGAG